MTDVQKVEPEGSVVRRVPLRDPMPGARGLSRPTTDFCEGILLWQHSGRSRRHLGELNGLNVSKTNRTSRGHNIIIRNV